MDIRGLVLLAFIAVLSAAQSGDGETVTITDDEEDIYLASGDGAIEGSGMEEITTTLPPHTECDALSKECWCLYRDMTEVPGTRRVGMPNCKPLDKPTTTVTVPVRKTQPTTTTEKATDAPAEAPTEDDADWEIIDPTIKPVVRIEDREPTTVKYNNKITIAPKVSNIDEEKEEETNEIGGAWKQVDDDSVSRERAAAGPFSFAHPGIMAAVIGGAIVGLLCAILLVMFIIYRMRKKDEGSYPLDDSKPLKNYAYAKAPSREFYA